MNAWALILGGAVLVVVAVVVARMLAARGAAVRPRAASAFIASGQSQLDPTTPRGYSPKNVGNDASARPWESTYDEPPAGLAFGGSAALSVPDGFDVDAFLRSSKANFVSLQDAWDRADIPSLRAMMTDDMLEQIQGQLAERERQSGGQPNQTEVVMIEARLLGIEDLGEGHMASVEFSGMVREDGAAGPNPFREIWSIARAKAGGGGWLVAGVQALQ